MVLSREFHDRFLRDYGLSSNPLISFFLPASNLYPWLHRISAFKFISFPKRAKRSSFGVLEIPKSKHMLSDLYCHGSIFRDICIYICNVPGFTGLSSKWNEIHANRGTAPTSLCAVEVASHRFCIGAAMRPTYITRVKRTSSSVSRPTARLDKIRKLTWSSFEKL